MTTITTKRFDQEMKARLSELKSGYHARELSEKDSSVLPEDIYVIEAEDTMVGYAVIWEYPSGKALIHKAEQDYFTPDEKHLEKDFYIDIKNKTNIVFIEALDVLKEYERQGYAAYFIDWLKTRHPKQKMYVYSIGRSKNFWYKQGFKVVGNTLWMSYN